MCGNFCCCPPLNLPAEQPVFGSLFGDPNNFTIASANIPVNFLTAGPTSGMIADPTTDSITVTSFGVYEINFSLTNQFNTPDSISVRYRIFINNTEIPTSRIFFRALQQQAGMQDPGSKTILITLNPNDIITVRPLPTEGGPFSYINPTLVVKKIF